MRRAELREYVAGPRSPPGSGTQQRGPALRPQLPAPRGAAGAAVALAGRGRGGGAQRRAHLAEGAHGPRRAGRLRDLARLRRGTALDVERLHAVRATPQVGGARLARVAGPAGPDSRHLARVSELCQARRDAQPRVDWPGVEVPALLAVGCCGADELTGAGASAARNRARPASLRWNWRRRAVPLLGPGLGRLELRRDPRGPLDHRALPSTLQVGWRAGESACAPSPEATDGPVKELLRSAGVLPWMRPGYPLGRRPTGLVAVADLAVEADYRRAGLPQSLPAAVARRAGAPADRCRRRRRRRLSRRPQANHCVAALPPRPRDSSGAGCRARDAARPFGVARLQTAFHEVADVEPTLIQ